MRTTFQRLSVILTVLCASPLAAQTARPAADITAAAIQEALKQAPKDATSDVPMRVVDVGGYNVGVYVVSRPKNSARIAALHETKVTEVYTSWRGPAR